jgi:hypothetical protein
MPQAAVHSLLVLLASLAIVVAGCGSSAKDAEAPTQERRLLGKVLVAQLRGSTIVASVVEHAQCRPARSKSIPWTSCGEEHSRGVRISLRLPGLPDRDATTNDDGEVRFDLSPIEPSADLVAEPTATIATTWDPTFSKINLTNGEVRNFVSLRASPLLQSWETKVASRRSATPPAISSGTNASDAAWAEARQAQAERNAAALDDAENKVKTLEQTKEPWGDGELEALASAGKVIDDSLKHSQDAKQPLDPKLERLSSRWEKLAAGPGKRAMVQRRQRDAQSRAAEAKRQAEQAKQIFPICVNCCLRSFAGATTEHCNATCAATPNTYVRERNIFDSTLVCQ